jgi:methyl-accepting chemotaxis protein
MANGNYAVTSKYPDKYVGEYAGIIAALRRMIHQMNDTLHQINDASNQVSAGSNNLAQAAQSLAEGATDQSASNYRQLLRILQKELARLQKIP